MTADLSLKIPLVYLGVFRWVDGCGCVCLMSSQNFLTLTVHGQCSAEHKVGEILASTKLNTLAPGQSSSFMREALGLFMFALSVFEMEEEKFSIRGAIAGGGEVSIQRPGENFRVHCGRHTPGAFAMQRMGKKKSPLIEWIKVARHIPQGPSIPLQ